MATRKTRERGSRRPQPPAVTRGASLWRRPAAGTPLLLTVTFAIKLVVLLQLYAHPLLQPDAGLDTTVYVQLAKRVLAGNVALAPGLYFVSPFYIYFLALVLQAASGSFFWVRLVQIGLGALAVWLIFRTAEQWHGRRAAWIAGGLAALTGLFTFYEVLLLQAAVDPILTAAALACFAFALGHRSTTWFGAAGLAFGVQTLNRPNVLAAAIGLAVILLGQRRWRPSLAFAAGLLIALLPVTVRNYVVAGDLSPVSSHGGLNFYIGNNAEADGTYHMVQGITPSMLGQQQDARRVAEEAVGRHLDDSEVSAYFYSRGWIWIREHPAAALGLLARKIAYTFNAATLSLNYSYSYYAYDERTLLRFLVVGPWLLIPLGLTGIWLGAPADSSKRRAFWTWAAFVPLYALSVAVFFVSSRYRLPLLIPLCVTSGAAVDRFLSVTSGLRRTSDDPVASGFSRTDQVGSGSSRTDPVVSGFSRTSARARLAIALAVFAILAVGANWRFGLDDGRTEERTRMAVWLIGQQRFGDAEARIPTIERDSPMPGILHFRVGRAFLAHQQYDAAIRHLQRATEIDPGRPETDYALGQALLDGSRPKEALPHLRRAYDAGVRIDLAGYDLARALAMTGDRPGAIRVLQRVRPRQANDAESWYSLGELAAQVQAPRLAEAFMREASRLQPTASKPREQLGLALAAQGRFEEAAPELQEAARLDPSNPAAQLNFAVVLAELGRGDEALPHVQEALRLKPDYDRAQKFLELLSKGKR